VVPRRVRSTPWRRVSSTGRSRCASNVSARRSKSASSWTADAHARPHRRLVRRAHGLPCAAAPRARRGDSRRCALGVRVRQRAARVVPQPGADGLDAHGHVHALDRGCLGERVLHPAQGDFRLLRARHARLRCAGDGRRARHALAAGGAVRRVQKTARGDVVDWPRVARRGAGLGAHGVPLAVGSEGVLGHQGRDQHRRHRSGARADAADVDRRRCRLRSDHADALLRAARGGLASDAGGLGGVARGVVPQARRHRSAEGSRRSCCTSWAG
jgi:hypothetical protein